MNTLSNPWRRFRASRGAGHETLTLLLCLLIGLLVAPLALYAVGGRVLGAYANGGYFNLVADMLRALAAGSLPFWLFVLAPYGAIWVLRIWRWSWRAD